MQYEAIIGSLYEEYAVEGGAETEAIGTGGMPPALPALVHEHIQEFPCVN